MNHPRCLDTMTPAVPASSDAANLPTRRGFGGHLAACIAGAAVDNVFRAVAGKALVQLADRHAGVGTEAARDLGHFYSNLAGLAFMLPFLLMAPLAGSLGDRWAKHRLIRWLRVADVPICLLGGWAMAVAFAGGGVVPIIATLVCLGVVSAFFAPVKLAVIPELVEERRLASANSALAAATLVAIIAGQCLAMALDPGRYSDGHRTSGPLLMLLVICTGLCALGVIGAWRVPVLPAAAPRTPLAMPWAVVGQLRALGRVPGLWAPALGLAGFWSLAIAASINLTPLLDRVYHLDLIGIGVLQITLTIGIVAGSLVAPLLMHARFTAGAPVTGALIAGLALAMAGWHAGHGGGVVGFAILLFVTGFGAGLWEIPLTVLVQSRTPGGERNQLMSAVNVLGVLGMVLTTGVLLALPFVGVPLTHAPDLFVAIGLVTVVLATLAGAHWFNLSASWVLATLLRLAYRVRTSGAERFPMTGGCLVVCNHLSYVDGLILGAALPRPARFLVYRSYVQMPVVGAFLRAYGVIPVASEDRRRALIAAIEAAIATAKAGGVVAIFPEGKLTRSGHMDSFQRGMERIARGAGVPVVPAHLHGLWGTITSRARQRSWPRPRRPVGLRVGAPLPSDVDAATARSEVMSLAYEAAQDQTDRDPRSLGRVFLAAVRRHPRRLAIRDAQGTLTYVKLAGIAWRLLPLLELAADEERVGVLLPPGRAGTIVNVALALAGRTAVNLNHTAGAAQVERMCQIAGVRTVITASLYLRRIGDPVVPGRRVLVEELLPRLKPLHVLLAMAKLLALPLGLIDRTPADRAAAIIFSSGSTGDPKGVLLTHRQILANCRAVADALHLDGDRDVLLSPLPLFHSFGLVPGLWLGLALGLPVAAHPDPTDGKMLGELAVAAGATFLISTPTFVRGWMRRIEPAQFKTLRLAVVGAERCPVDLKEAFKERYGADLLEGYGCTELGPVVACNLPTVVNDGVTEVHSRDGSVGRPLPGIHVVAIDPATHAVLPAGGEGLLVVRSPARMAGYFGRDDLSAQAFRNGGYNTGDIGRVDADGFVHITGRLARFAKIAGEMVPLDNIEKALQVLCGERCEVAVASVPDPARGERLVVLHTGWPDSPDDLLKALDGQPALWRPKARDVHQVADLPKLGTGKRDLAGLKKLAAEHAGSAA